MPPAASHLRPHVSRDHAIRRWFCLDLDGTVLEYDCEPGRIHDEAIAFLNALDLERFGWIINSGREVRDQLRILDLSVTRGLEVLPEALLCCEAEIYVREHQAYKPWDDWNETVARAQASFNREVRLAMAEDIAVWGRELGAHRLYLDDRVTGVVLAGLSPEEAAAVVARFREALGPLGDRGTVTENALWVSAMPGGYHKGRLLEEWMVRHGVPPASVLAIGDDHNDLSMLDGSVVPHVGCPADARPMVAELVEAKGGRIASRPGPPGTVELMTLWMTLGEQA